MVETQYLMCYSKICNSLLIALFLVGCYALILYGIFHIKNPNDDLAYRTVAVSRVTNQVLCVSGYWSIEKSKYGTNSSESSNVYRTWLQSSLKIHAPYVFFHGGGNDERFLRAIRNESFATLWKKKPLSTFRTSKFNIPLVRRIWGEKVELMWEASRLIKGPEWIVWVDAAINTYREEEPPAVIWPQSNLSCRYPRGKFIYIQTKFAISGTAFIIHRSILGDLREAFYRRLAYCIRLYNTTKSFSVGSKCGDDQHHFNELKQHQPNLFYRVDKLSEWGDIIKSNYNNSTDEQCYRPVVAFKRALNLNISTSIGSRLRNGTPPQVTSTDERQS